MEDIVKEDGTILKEMHERKWEKDESAPLGGYFKSIKSWLVKYPYHGYVRIYASINDEENETWYEYSIKFTDDVIVDIEKIENER